MPGKYKIRNFSIIAHIDHGKSTLADRIMELAGIIEDRDKKDQYLDRMDLERERGITIKAQTVRMPYVTADGTEYLLNLIDTPGHVDFSYEVSRSLAACDGALLVIDATQGVEAQTLANVFLALDNDLEVLPVLNKIDLPSAEPEKIAQEIEEVVGLDCSDITLVSAKTGEGVAELMEKLIRFIPPPRGRDEDPLKALIFDSWYDPYMGVVVLFRILDGSLEMGQPIMMCSNKKKYEVTKLGVFAPEPKDVRVLQAGEVGFLCAGLKEIKDARVGDTITHPAQPTPNPYPDFKKAKPMVFCGLYPIESAEFDSLRGALEKLQLNDSALYFEAESSQALGFGFRCGFLGLLHMEIIQERLEREFQVDLVATAPTVVYQVLTTENNTLEIDNPSMLPEPGEIQAVYEPYVRLEIHVPNEFVGNVLSLCEEKRGIQKDMQYLTSTRVIITYELPFAEIVFDFFDRLKSVTKGFASLDYEILEFRESDLVKLDILINGEQVDAMSAIVHRDKAYFKGRSLAQKLRNLIPRQLFEVVIQASIGQKIVARERVPPLRKNVTAKCYGGDITRKRKLLERQKKGKKRMKKMGSVDIPQEAFFAALQTDDK
ncbi:MAG: translation elongation factor 4 [Desulfonatronovibrionaceae bacterium]